MGNRIRELRKNNGLTMKQLGQQIGLAESTISQYETGKRSPDNETLLKLGEIFGVTVGYILGSEEKEKPVGRAADELEEELFNLCSRLTPAQKQRQIQILRDILGVQDK
mgnify:CR=1 FL=1